jgi:hypothetical protein
MPSLSKVIPGECVVSQHKQVVADFRFLVRARKVKQAKIARTKWWKLEGEASKVFKEIVIEGRRRCKQHVGEDGNMHSKGSGCDLKDARWWNEDVQKAIKEKKECYKCLYQDQCADNIEKYKVAK